MGTNDYLTLFGWKRQAGRPEETKPDGQRTVAWVRNCLRGVLLHGAPKPLIENVALEPPLAADFGRRKMAFSGQLVHCHDVQPEILGNLSQRHDLPLVMNPIFLHGTITCLPVGC